MSRFARPHGDRDEQHRPGDGGGAPPPPWTTATSGSRCRTRSSRALIVTIDTTIVLIGLPAIFRGIHVNPLAPGNTKYMLWMILGFTIVAAVLVVSLGRLGDIYGRVRDLQPRLRRLHRLLDPALGLVDAAARRARRGSIAMRIGQGLGGAMLLGNAGAIVTDAFPVDPARHGARHPEHRGGRRLDDRAGAGRRARADLLAADLPRLGADRACSGRSGPTLKLREIAERRPARIDWWGNLTFAAGLIARDGRDHDGHPALRPPRDELDQPAGDRRDRRRPGAARRVRGGSRQRVSRAAVRAQPVPHPRLHRRATSRAS